MADADLLAVEGFNGHCCKLRQLQPLRDIDDRFACLGRDLFDAVLRFFQVEKRLEALRLFHRVNIAALEVFDKLRLQRFGIAEVDDADGHGRGVGHLRGAVTPRSGHDLEAALIQRPHKQGRKNALGADAFGQLLQALFLEDAARVGAGFGEQRERQVAVFGGIDDGGFHDDWLLSSG